MQYDPIYDERHARAQAMLDEADRLKRQGKHKEARIAVAAAMSIDPNIFRSGLYNTWDFTDPNIAGPLDVWIDRSSEQKPVVELLALATAGCIIGGLCGMIKPLHDWVVAGCSNAATGKLQNDYARSWISASRTGFGPSSFGPSSLMFVAGICALVALIVELRKRRR